MTGFALENLLVYLFRSMKSHHKILLQKLFLSCISEYDISGVYSDCKDLSLCLFTYLYCTLLGMFTRFVFFL